MTDEKKKKRQPKELNIQIGERCRQSREAACYTQEQLAERIGVSTQFLSDAERGVTGMSVATIIKICTVLDISADFLLLGKNSLENIESPLSVYSRMQRLSAEEQELMEAAVNILLKSIHLHR